MDFGLGSLFTAGASMFDTYENNQNAQQMQSNAEAYNTQMSNTAYQRASVDMKAAGLNPMMMASGGMSASAPTIAPVTAPKSNVAGAIQGGISSAVASATVDKLVADIAKTKAETITESVKPDLVQATTGKTLAETTTEDQKPSLVRSETAKAQADTGLAKADTATKQTLLPVAQNSALTATNEQNTINPTVRKVLDVLGYGGGKIAKGLEPVTSVVGAAHGLSRFNN